MLALAHVALTILSFQPFVSLLLVTGSCGIVPDL